MLKIKQKSGETLIETVISLLILSLTVGVITQMTLTSIAMSGRATTLNRELAEEVELAERRNPYRNGVEEDGLVDGVTGFGTRITITFDVFDEEDDNIVIIDASTYQTKSGVVFFE